MKKISRSCILIFAALFLFSIVAAAASVYNEYCTFSFTKNEQKKQSNDTVKPPDGDPKCYVTTLSSYSGIQSNVFTNGGTFYARSRWGMNQSISYSKLLTFTSNVAKNTTYSTRIFYGDNYILWAEIDGVNENGRIYWQSVRWCP